MKLRATKAPIRWPRGGGAGHDSGDGDSVRALRGQTRRRPAGPRRARIGERQSDGRRDVRVGRGANLARGDSQRPRPSRLPRVDRGRGIGVPHRALQAPGTQRYGSSVSEPEPSTEARRIAAQARDRVRFEEEALELADQIYRVARRLVGSREEAEDLVQETYARAFRSWRSFTPGTNMRAWLFRILTNLNLDRGRRIQRTPDMQPLEESDYYLANKLASAGGEEMLEQEQVVERLSQDSIVRALSEIPSQFRDVVVLVDIGDFAYADAAQILDIPIGTVMSRLHRGRRALKQWLAEETLA